MFSDSTGATLIIMQYQPVYRPTRATADIIATVILFVTVAFASAAVFFLALFSAMGTDSCGVRNCDLNAFDAGMMTIMAGIPAAWAIGGIGTIVAAVRGPRLWMWVWPAVGLLALIALGAVGLGIESRAVM